MKNTTVDALTLEAFVSPNFLSFDYDYDYDYGFDFLTKKKKKKKKKKMDAFFGAQSARASSSLSYGTLKNFRQFSPVVQNHLRLVFLTLCCALGASAVGAYLHIMMNIGGLLTFLGFLGCVGWLSATPLHEEMSLKQRKRLGILMGAAIFEGATVGPLIQIVIDFDPSILVTTFVGTAVAFGCFSGVAMIAKRREYLYLGALLSSGITILFWLQFASAIFGGSTTMFNVELYFGLLLFLGYVVFDTQEIIEKAHLGDLDYVKHALTLFVDFVGVLVRLLIIRMKNAEKEEEKRRKKS